jgi:hypothetical protein
VARRPLAAETGQGTVEWIGLVLLVALVALGIATALAGSLPGISLAEAILGRIECAIDLSRTCSSDPELAGAYGPELASLVAANAPELIYEPDSSALPVDFRSCRGPACGNGPRSGPVTKSNTGLPAAAFVHVVDCRAQSAAREEDDGFDCSGDRAGMVYVQYWLYYENSTSLRDIPGRLGFHEDDWESVQIRVSPDGTVDSRASSHHGYDYHGGASNWLSDAGLVRRSAWGPSTGHAFVSGGSHAGHVYEAAGFSIQRTARTVGRLAVDVRSVAGGRRRLPFAPKLRFSGPAPVTRWTPPGSLELIPIETLDPQALATRFAITPPWLKPVYLDPEDTGT